MIIWTIVAQNLETKREQSDGVISQLQAAIPELWQSSKGPAVGSKFVYSKVYNTKIENIKLKRV